MYEMADQSWRSRPKKISAKTIKTVAARIAEHARVRDLAAVEVILHGGESLLAGHDSIREIVTTVRSAVAARVDVSLQTNATLLDDDYLRLFDELGIGIGVSLDGGERTHDRSRRTAAGKGAVTAPSRTRWNGSRRPASPTCSEGCSASTLLESGSLTGLGESFVGGMVSRLDSWAYEPIPRQAVTLARSAADRHLSLWRERNGR